MNKFKSKQNKFLHDAVVRTGYGILNIFYDLKIYGLDYLKELKGKPFFLLPKHQSYADTFIVSGQILKKVKRRGQYIMKRSLPCFYDILGGGLRVTRPKDIAMAETREEKKSLLREAKQQLKEFDTKIPQMLNDSHMVVIYPEGERNWKKTGELNVPLLEKIVSMRERIGRDVFFVPFDIDYETPCDPYCSAILKNPFSSSSIKNYGKRIISKIGIPIKPKEYSELEEHLVKEVRLFKRHTQI